MKRLAMAVALLAIGQPAKSADVSGEKLYEVLCSSKDPENRSEFSFLLGYVHGVYHHARMMQAREQIQGVRSIKDAYMGEATFCTPDQVITHACSECWLRRGRF